MSLDDNSTVFEMLGFKQAYSEFSFSLFYFIHNSQKKANKNKSLSIELKC